MEHLTSILWLLSWPVLIYVAYRASVFAIKIFENNLTEDDRKA